MDNFDSYPTGTQLHGVGGWKGWANNPTAGALTTDAQGRSAPNSVEVAGATDLVHEFSGYDSGSWIFSAWQFIPSGTTGTPYFILLNQYDDLGATLSWSVQVLFDTSTGMIDNTGVSGEEPIFYRQNQWVELRVVIDLDADTQAFFYDGEGLYKGTWSGEVSGGGMTSIGAVTLLANGSSPVFYDDISLTDFRLVFKDGFEGD